MTVERILHALRRRPSTTRVLAVGCARCGAWTNPRRLRMPACLCRPCADRPGNPHLEPPGSARTTKEVNP